MDGDSLKMTMKRLSFRAKVQLVLWAIPALILVIYLAKHFIFVSDEALIERLIKKGEKAVEAESVSDCLEIVGSDFVLLPGDITRDDMANGWLTRQFKNFDEMSLSVKNVEVAVSNVHGAKTATASFVVSGTVKWNGQTVLLAYSRSEPLRFEMLLSKEKKKWKVMRLELPLEIPDLS
jgi:hypothetical protein